MRMPPAAALLAGLALAAACLVPAPPGAASGPPDAARTAAEGCSPTLAAPEDPPGQVHDFLHEGTPLPADSALPATGTLRTVMLFVDFAEHPGTGSTQTLYDRLVPSAVDFYDRASYGRFALEVEHVPGWHRMPQPYASYGVNQSRVDHADQREFIADAVAAADAEVDFSDVQAVYVVASQDSLPGAFVLPKLHAGQGVTVDGVELRAWMGIGSVAWYEPEPGMGAKNSTWHDTAHWLGLPDLYGRTLDDQTTWEYAGSWDLMSDNVIGGHFLAWHAFRLGWIDPGQLRCLDGPGTLEAELTPASTTGGTKALVVPTGPSTAFVAEVRERTGLDAGLCDGGVLVYSVDARVWNGSGPVRVQRAQADDPALSGYYDCGPAYNAAYDVGAGEVATFTDEATGVTIEVVEETAAGYVVRATVPGEPEPRARAVDLTLRKHLKATGSVTVLDGADGCVAVVPVTVQRRTASGWRTVMSSVTTDTGTFRIGIPDKPGRYRVRAAATADGGCALATSGVSRHRHPG